MKQFEKTYANHSELTLRAHQIHGADNLEIEGVRFGYTSRTDRFAHELKRNNVLKQKRHTKLRRPKVQQYEKLAVPPSLPPIDWRDMKGVSYISPVQQQGECGCCFAFAAATVLEFWSAKHGHPKPLSVQHLMDCTSTKGGPNDGCDGGLMEYVFEYGSKYSVILESDKTYNGFVQDRCPSRDMFSHVHVGNWKVIERSTCHNAEDQLEWLLHAYGPIAIGVDSSQWDNYRGGTFKHTMCTTDIDHAATIVGYTKDAWIVKNSWGTDWGDNGYIYLERGHNTCGVAEYVTYVTDAYPILKTKPSWPVWSSRMYFRM
jgi:C1A family cysteine protease